MTSKELTRIGEALFGEWWKEPLSDALGVNYRTMRRWAKGESRIPDAIVPDLRTLAKRRGSALVKISDELEEV